jgi:hypothetical protein
MSTVGRVALAVFVLTACAASDLNLARQHVTSGETQQAEALILAHLSHVPDNAEAHYLLGLVRLTEGQFEPAMAEFNRAKKLDARYEELTQLAILEHFAVGSVGVPFEMYADPGRLQPTRMRIYSSVSGKRIDESRPGWEKQSVVVRLRGDSVRPLLANGFEVQVLAELGELRRVRLTGWVPTTDEEEAATTELRLLDWDIHVPGTPTIRVMATLENVGKEPIEDAEVDVEARDQLNNLLHQQRIKLRPSRIEGGKTVTFSMQVRIESSTMWVLLTIQPYGEINGHFGPAGESIHKSKQIRPLNWQGSVKMPEPNGGFPVVAPLRHDLRLQD